MAVFSTLKATVAASAVAIVAACGGDGGCSGHDDHDHDHDHHHDAAGATAEASASHILVDSVEKANEIKTAIAYIVAAGEVDVQTAFAEAAMEHSTCPSKENGGKLGHFEKGQMVPEFENEIFNPENKVLEVLGPVETQFGQHLIMIESRLNADGTKDGNVPVLKKATASHILVEEEEQAQKLKEEIEGFNAEEQAQEFGRIAEENSKCPSGKQAQGSLGSFKQGQMVPEFDNIIFGEEYAVKTVHGPIKTQFGFHLIYIEERSGVEEVAVADSVAEVADSEAAAEVPSEESSEEKPSASLDEEKTEESSEEEPSVSLDEEKTEESVAEPSEEL